MGADGSEVEEVNTYRDVMLGVMFLADVSERVATGTYDVGFGPEFRTAVYKRTDGNEHMLLLDGRVHGTGVARQFGPASVTPTASPPTSPEPPAKRGEMPRSDSGRGGGVRCDGAAHLTTGPR